MGFDPRPLSHPALSPSVEPWPTFAVSRPAIHRKTLRIYKITIGNQDSSEEINGKIMEILRQPTSESSSRSARFMSLWKDSCSRLWRLIKSIKSDCFGRKTWQRKGPVKQMWIGVSLDVRSLDFCQISGTECS
jgi:hypothetical protein